jgi:RNA polymerase sigma-70 factor, ECF subfamily
MGLVELAQKGREAAFIQLFDEHHLPLYRFAYRLTASVVDAEDIVQECFLELLRPDCSYNPSRTPIRTYLFGIVRNQSLKRLRKNELTNRAVTGTTQGPSPERELLRTEMQDAVALAVMQLPETQREVVILAHYEQMRLGEIAVILALDVGAVKSRLQRARAALKEILAAYATREERRP